ncbi:PDZK1-interacting protein 1 isoform X1 [Micropterus dolomieu]|uniref:PDZK1-interacting protein 1 isoform X1 n=2 Tax=Micropterus dolomieu TaxID=147949 RepID=UPI001E8E797B|nr:PDZK1-interacting protein 1 isoform X1 [Micropterus dolomieu]
MLQRWLDKLTTAAVLRRHKTPLSRLQGSGEPAMAKLCAVISSLLLTVGVVAAQTDQTQISERLLPQWLTGIIAVSIFLFLSFVVFLVKKAWCEEPSRRKVSVVSDKDNDYAMTIENAYETNGNAYETSLDMVRSKENTNAYNNLVIDSTDDKVTSM